MPGKTTGLTREVAVLIVHYRGLDDVERCLRSLARHTPDGLLVRIVIVDNEGSPALREIVAPYVEDCDLLTPGQNLGFAEGNNLGWNHISEHHPHIEFLMLLNQDTAVENDWLQPLVDFMDSEPSAGSVQPAVLLMQEPDRINTIGNESHFLGFGFVGDYGLSVRGLDPTPREIAYASGSGTLLKTSLIRDIGLFDDFMFMYSEDTDLGWRIRQSGLKNFCVPQSVIYHDYTPKAPVESYFWLERNRWLLILTHYHWATLVLLSPALLLMECGQLAFAVANGLMRPRWQVYRNLLSRETQRHWRRRRREVQRISRIRQRELVRPFVGAIATDVIQNRLLRRVANPLLNLYWSIVRRLIFW